MENMRTIKVQQQVRMLQVFRRTPWVSVTINIHFAVFPGTDETLALSAKTL